METKKTCSDCKEEKLITDFYKNVYKGKNCYNPYCKKCRGKRRLEYQRTYRASNKDVINEKKRSYYKKRMDDSLLREHVNTAQRDRYPRYVVKRLLHNAEYRAKTRGFEFNITIDDIVIPEFCPLLGISIFTGNKENYNNSPSLDRVDNTKGYIKGNVKVISTLANNMKNSGTIEQLLEFAKNIESYLK